MSYRLAEHYLRRLLGPNAEFRDGQWEAVEALVVRRESALVVQRTGWGKSLVYFLATRLLRAQGAGPTILISPLLSLMRDQIRAAHKLKLHAATINSANASKHAHTEARLADNEIDILLISPERLANAHFREEVWPRLRNRVGLLVVDEAHCISDWGHDFRPNYRQIIHLLDELPPDTPLLGTTATANDRVVADVNQIFGGNLNILRGPLTRSSLRLYVFQEVLSGAQRLAMLSHLLSTIPGSGIIYCLTTSDCLQVARWLQSEGFQVKPYYSTVEKATGESRVVLEQQLLNNEVKALVASVALGMGFDKPDLHFVIHYQMPGSIIAYYQQIGRAGRAIDQAHIVLMHGPEDEDIHHYFIDTAFPKATLIKAVVQALTESRAGLQYTALQRKINVRPKTLTQVLVQLQVERIIERRKSKYVLIDHIRLPDYVRWAEVTRQRLIESEQMQAYVTESECLMRAIAASLDDPTEIQPCGRCMNCTGQRSRFKPSVESVEAASRFLRVGEPIIFKPRKRWPAKISTDLRGRLNSINHIGLALCYYHDHGWGETVRYGKYRDNRFTDDLVEAAASLIQEQLLSLINPPMWIAAVPSLRRPTLVPDFSARLAVELGLPFIDVVRKTDDRPEQKTMQNSFQQVGNLLDSFAIQTPIPPTPVLLVDDMIDSGWTFTLIGHLLREHGSGDVYPFALAKVSAKSG
ncbi:MAG: RecQ family ATP-dependent DNA helicase [Aggregatilineales bacterium]